MPGRQGVTFENWLDPPHNRSGFLHVRELARTARISRGGAAVGALPYALRDLGALRFAHGGASVSLEQMLLASYTDGLLVLRDGRVVAEWYSDGMAASDTHLLMSVSKSLTAALCGVLVERGVLDPDEAVPACVPALRGSCFEGCTLQHLLDMRAGTRFDEEDYDDPESDGRLIEQVSGYRARRHADLPPDTRAWIRQLENDGPHGGAFRYRSILTDVLAWAIEERSGERFPELFSREIWSPLGAERDADIIVDASGFPVVEGGICTTLRDLARFGWMCLQEGEFGGRRVVPSAWLRRLRAPPPELVSIFPPRADGRFPQACYHDQWWVLDGPRGIYAGYGIHGQQLLIHHPSRTLVAKLSSWPRGEDPALAALQDAGLLALCEAPAP